MSSFPYRFQHSIVNLLQFRLVKGVCVFIFDLQFHLWQNDRGLLRATVVTWGGTNTEVISQYPSFKTPAPVLQYLNAHPSIFQHPNLNIPSPVLEHRILPHNIPTSALQNPNPDLQYPIIRPLISNTRPSKCQNLPFKVPALALQHSNTCPSNIQRSLPSTRSTISYNRTFSI